MLYFSHVYLNGYDLLQMKVYFWLKWKKIFRFRLFVLNAARECRKKKQIYTCHMNLLESGANPREVF